MVSSGVAVRASAHGGGEEGGARPSRQQPSAMVGRDGISDTDHPGRYFIYRPALRFSGSSIPKRAVQIRYDGLQRGRPLGLVEAQQLKSVLRLRRPITEESRAQPRKPDNASVGRRTPRRRS